MLCNMEIYLRKRLKFYKTICFYGHILFQKHDFNVSFACFFEFFSEYHILAQRILFVFNLNFTHKITRSLFF